MLVDILFYLKKLFFFQFHDYICDKSLLKLIKPCESLPQLYNKVMGKFVQQV